MPSVNVLDSLPSHEWSWNIRRALTAMNVYTWDDLTSVDPKNLCRHAGFGIKSLNFLRFQLIDRGLQFKIDHHPIVYRTLGNTKVAGVYFLRCDQFVKIGKAGHVKSRLVQLAAMIPYPVELLAVQRVAELHDLTRVEHSLHVKFRHLRHRGEWFRFESELVEYVAGLAAQQ